MKNLKIICGLALIAILTSNVWSMTRWNERRGVSDDLCYLRQAHLFQKFGLRGLDTDIASDSDYYFSTMTKDVGHPEWGAPETSICHVPMSLTGKRVMQYPPGTGFLLAAFPEGFQVVPLYAAATILVLLISMLAISYAKLRSSILATTGFGCMALYFMINPAKASYSIAPTMVVCAAAGFLTAWLFNDERRRSQLTAAALLGLLLGLSVSFRIPNLLLSAGCFVVLFVSFIQRRDIATLFRGALFGLSYLAGLIPNLVANAINAGSPLATTYGGGDVAPPEVSLTVLRQYLADPQCLLILAAAGWTIWLLTMRRSNMAALATGVNLVVNLGFFLSHPIFTQYYLVPIAMLALWTLLFDRLMNASRSPSPAVVAR